MERRQQFEKHLIIEKQAKELCAQIQAFVDDVKLGSTKKEVSEKWKDKQMILNMACLMHKDNVERLGRKLSQFKNEGYAVRFTGPWPPYSFVGQISEPKTEGNR